MSNEVKVFKRKKSLRLAVFDLDGTLTTVRSPFLYVSEALGSGEKARNFAYQYANGEISYEDWGKGIVALWKGIDSNTIQNIVTSIPFRVGAVQFVKELRERGVYVAILSVAFEQHVGFRAIKLNVDHFECNELLEIDGAVTGEYRYRVNHSNKSNFVREMQKKLGINAASTLVAGDTTGDIAMFKEAAVSIAINPECPEVAESATLTLPNVDWRRALDKLRDYFVLN